MDNKNEKREEEETIDRENSSITSIVNKIKNTSLYRLVNQKEVKRYIVVAFSAVFIGLLFGFTTLKVLDHVGQPKDVGAITTGASQPDQNGNDSKTITEQITSLQAFVIQGGVFSDQANLEKWEQHFIEKGYNVVKWERDNLYYLFIGLGSSENELSHLKDDLLNKDLEAYIKVWETNSYDLNLAKSDLKWIESFVSLLEESIDNINDDNYRLKEKWDTFISTGNEQGKDVYPFKETIETILKENDLQNEIDKRYFLLKMWHSFEVFAISNNE